MSVAKLSGDEAQVVRWVSLNGFYTTRTYRRGPQPFDIVVAASELSSNLRQHLKIFKPEVEYWLPTLILKITGWADDLVLDEIDKDTIYGVCLVQLAIMKYQGVFEEESYA